STYYHRYTVDFYLHLKLIARSTGLALDSDFDHRLALALDHLMWMTRPDGTTPLIGDDDGGSLLKLGARPSNDFGDTPALGSALFERGDWKHAAGGCGSEILWLLGEEGLSDYDRIQSAPPSGLARAFDDSGFLIARDGWTHNDSYVSMRCGPTGSAHSHAD